VEKSPIASIMKPPLGILSKFLCVRVKLRFLDYDYFEEFKKLSSVLFLVVLKNFPV